MNEAWLEASAEQFWEQVGGEIPFPRDLELVISAGFDVVCKSLPDLTIEKIQGWLIKQEINAQFLCHDRSLSGCIVAQRGHAVIFTCCDDPEEEQRFTVGHEMSHYLLDYWQPRQKALKAFGTSILELLNGDRPPTTEERFNALLNNVRLGTYFNLLPRSTDNQIEYGVVLKAEERADYLALELLAPLQEVLKSIHQVLPQPRSISRHLCLATVCNILQSTYGLPKSVANDYAIRCGDFIRPYTIMDRLGLL